MVCRWLQELLCYHFTIIHISNKVMVDLYALTRQFGHIIGHCITISAILGSRDRSKCPLSYAATEFSNLALLFT